MNPEQRPTPETDAAIKAAIQNEDEDHNRLAAVSHKLERERDEAKEKLYVMRNKLIESEAYEAGLVADIEVMREAIKEACALIKSGSELWPVWVDTPTTTQVHQGMLSALAKLQPFIKQ